MARKYHFYLIIVLLATSLALGVVGALLRATVAQDVEQLKDIPAPAVPLLLLADPTLLEASQAPGPETLSKPGSLPPTVSPEEPASEPIAEQPETAPAENTGERPLPSVEEDLSSAGGQQEAPASGQEGTPTLGAVEETYFDDALFVGDSRTLGLAQYGRLGQADYFADSGMTVFNVLETKVSDENFSKTTLPDLLAERTYGKIYLMLGINEIGYPFESLTAQYESVVETLRSMEPQATIFLCANLHVTEAAAEATPRLAPAHMEELNGRLAALADGETIFYLDVNPLFCDENGYLKMDLTGDGVHPYGTGYQLWAQWLMGCGLEEVQGSS